MIDKSTFKGILMEIRQAAATEGMAADDEAIMGSATGVLKLSYAQRRLNELADMIEERYRSEVREESDAA